MPLAFLVTLATACGGGSRGSDEKKAFVEKADALCKATAERVQGLSRLLAFDPGAAIVQVLPAAETLVADLKAIPPPTDAQTTAIMSAYDKELGQFRAVAMARQRGDIVTQARLLDEIQTESEVLDKQAVAYGFKECGHR